MSAALLVRFYKDVDDLTGFIKLFPDMPFPVLFDLFREA